MELSFSRTAVFQKQPCRERYLNRRFYLLLHTKEFRSVPQVTAVMRLQIGPHRFRRKLIQLAEKIKPVQGKRTFPLLDVCIGTSLTTHDIGKLTLRIPIAASQKQQISRQSSLEFFLWQQQFHPLTTFLLNQLQQL